MSNCIQPTLTAVAPLSGACGPIAGYKPYIVLFNNADIASKLTLASYNLNENLITAIDVTALGQVINLNEGDLNVEEPLFDGSGTPMWTQQLTVKFKADTPAVEKALAILWQASGLTLGVEVRATGAEMSTATAKSFFEFYGIDNGGMNCRVQEGGSGNSVRGANKADEARTTLTFTGVSKLPRHYFKSGASATYEDDKTAFDTLCNLGYHG